MSDYVPLDMDGLPKKVGRTYSRQAIAALLKIDREQLAAVPVPWATTHGYVYLDGGSKKLVTLCDLPKALAEKWNCETDMAQNFANARLIVHAKKALARNVEIIEQLLAECDGEREARNKCEAALSAKDDAMGVLFQRLQAAGVDCSDLIS